MEYDIYNANTIHCDGFDHYRDYSLAECRDRLEEKAIREAAKVVIHWRRVVMLDSIDECFTSILSCHETSLWI